MNKQQLLLLHLCCECVCCGIYYTYTYTLPAHMVDKLTQPLNQQC